LRSSIGVRQDGQPWGAFLPLADAALDLSRWQFALTTIYHFIFVPLTIGLAYTGRQDEGGPSSCSP
jgi:hypothetical protein